MDIETKIKRLAKARERREQARDELARLNDILVQSPEWIKAAELAQTASTLITTIEADLRAAALQSYAETGVKKINPALSIREVTRLEYDPILTRQWCVENLPQALKLDTKALEKYAKAVAGITPVPGVNITKEPQATIATDLSSYLVESAADVEIDFDEIKELPF